MKLGNPRLHRRVRLALLICIMCAMCSYEPITIPDKNELVHQNDEPIVLKHQNDEPIVFKPSGEISVKKKYELNNTDRAIRLLKNDYIYGRKWWEIPTVIEEYKLIFFTVPKVGSTEWKLLFRKMMGMPPISPSLPIRYTQKPGTNNLTNLASYSLREAEIMMNSPDWTKAVFVREPKERILSAFLNKFVRDKFYFRQHCCNNLIDTNAINMCNRMIKEANFGYFLKRTQNCKDFHWGLQAEVLDEKWWPSINFVGYMHSTANDTKRLLESLVSVKNGASAWENVGNSGWGEDGYGGFMQDNSARHGNGAQNKLRTFYTPEYESFVEKYWAKDWYMDQYHFDELHLFDD